MNSSYHFIAIGGVGMSGLAKYLIQKGISVSGSDVIESKYTKYLKDIGADVIVGHSANNIKGRPTVVVSSAIKDNNPELKYAKELGLTIYHRSDLLAEIANNEKHFIGFAGTHGKTTTSGLASYILSKANMKPSFVVGGIIPEYNTNAEYSKDGRFFTAELDESDGTIVKYIPNTLVINNLEEDHLDFYTDGLPSILKTFDSLISNMKSDSKVIVNIDNNGIKQLKNIDKFITYSLYNGDYTAKHINYCCGYTEFDVFYHNKFLTKLKIILPGEHNVYNTLAVLAALHQNGIDISALTKYFESFTGMGRRFQKMGTINGCTIYDDYAHHPTEINSTLTALKSFTDKRIIAVFQPHRYSRLKSLWNDFKRAVSNVDTLIVTDVYAASEAPLDNINSSNFTKELNNAEYISGNINTVAKKIMSRLDSEHVLIGLGAGDITNLYKELEKEANGNY